MFPRESRLEGSLSRDGSVADSIAAESRADVCQADEASRERIWRSRGDGVEGRAMGTRRDVCL